MINTGEAKIAIEGCLRSNSRPPASEQVPGRTFAHGLSKVKVTLNQIHFSSSSSSWSSSSMWANDEEEEDDDEDEDEKTR